jgi:hypothetical protein
LGVSGAKIGCVLQVALGDAYPREIKLRRRDIASERQALATSILARNLPRQRLDVRCKSAFAEQRPAQSMALRIA